MRRKLELVRTLRQVAAMRDGVFNSSDLLYVRQAKNLADWMESAKGKEELSSLLGVVIIGTEATSTGATVTVWTPRPKGG